MKELAGGAILGMPSATLSTLLEETVEEPASRNSAALETPASTPQAKETVEILEEDEEEEELVLGKPKIPTHPLNM